MSPTSPPGGPRTTVRARRRLPVALPAGLGAAAALLALSTVGLTWVTRTVEGPLGAAGTAELQQLPGREVAPVVAALVPGVAAVVVVALLLRGAWRVTALVLAGLGAAAAAVAAARFAFGGDPDGGTTTAVPAVALLACLVVVACAGAAAWLTATAPATGAGRTAGDEPAADRPRAEDPRADDPRANDPRAEEPPAAADLWRELDEGRDPT